jgi:hypothetical protein
MEKLIKDGKVAILLHNYWTGDKEWYSEYKDIELLYHKEIIEHILEERHWDEFEQYVYETSSRKYRIWGETLNSLKVIWIPEGKPFTILDNEGEEEIRFLWDLEIIIL